MLNDLTFVFIATTLNSKQQDVGNSTTQSHWDTEEFALPFFLRLFPNMMWERPGEGEALWKWTGKELGFRDVYGRYIYT